MTSKKCQLVYQFLLYILWLISYTIKNCLVTISSVVQSHALARRDNSMRAGIEEDSEWGFLLTSESQKGVQPKKNAKNDVCSKTLALGVK